MIEAIIPVINVPVNGVVPLRPVGVRRAGQVRPPLLEVLHSARQTRRPYGVDGVVRWYLHVAPETVHIDYY